MSAREAEGVDNVCAHLRLYGDVQRGSRGLGADGSWAKRARQMKERISLGHDDGGVFGGVARLVRRRGAVEGVNVVGSSDILCEIWAGAVR